MGNNMDWLADHDNNSENKSHNLTAVSSQLPPWKILVVDDDEQVHQITQLALSAFQFQGRRLMLLCALSSQEAKTIIAEHDDIAMALIDVVMETEHAGLELVQYIREVQKNRTIRLILRTGQAGQAPEDRVIQEYEIDDYKEKTELTTQKLKTLLYSMLRAYRDLRLIEQQKQGLSRVIEASARVQNTASLKTYASCVLEQLTSLLGLNISAFYCMVQPQFEGETHQAMTLSATGEYVDLYSEACFDALPVTVSKRCKEVLTTRHSKEFDDALVLYASDERGVDNILYVNVNQTLSELDKQLLDIYMNNIELSFEKLILMADLEATSRELVFNLSNAVEARSKETGAHVERVSLVSEKLAQLYGLSEEEVSTITMAAPLHDIGKVAIPDCVLHKPDKLNQEEWIIMKKHVDYGVEILSHSKRALIRVGRDIAGTHHEKWDGTGYPNQLSGYAIPVSGRIVALADVFDALGAKRAYKAPWTDDEIMHEIKAQRGKHFEPKLVDLLLEHWDEFVAIREAHPD